MHKGTEEAAAILNGTVLDICRILCWVLAPSFSVDHVFQGLQMGASSLCGDNLLTLPTCCGLNLHTHEVHALSHVQQVLLRPTGRSVQKRCKSLLKFGQRQESASANERAHACTTAWGFEGVYEDRLMKKRNFLTYLIGALRIPALILFFQGPGPKCKRLLQSHIKQGTCSNARKGRDCLCVTTSRQSIPAALGPPWHSAQ